jgi:hypothetical protein
MRAAALPLSLLVLTAGSAAAEPYRLRADGFARTNVPDTPVGLVMLQGEDRERPWVDAEALVWMGNNPEGQGPADALVVLVRLHDPAHRGELRLGRQIVTAGAMRPLHLDGVDGTARLPTGTRFEAFGGVPVVPSFGWTSFDWAAGGRVAQEIGPVTTTGVSYLRRQESAHVAYEEAGFDFASSPTQHLDLGVRGAYDLVSPGLTEAVASVGLHLGAVRPDLYASHRSPSRLLPATSLFSALGDIPSDVAGVAVMWHAAPRLDLVPNVAVRRADDDVGADLTLRTTLRLDDDGRGALLLELRRQGALDSWTGGRTGARVPLSRVLTASTELELAFADDPRGRGTVWPWALGALTWHGPEHWEVAGAVEASSTPRNARAVDAIVRVGRSWGAR